MDDDSPPSGGRATTAGQFAPVLKSPFRNLLYASLTSSLGDWVGLVAIIALTTSILGSNTRAAAFGLSAVLAARVLPTMLLGPLAGVFADRWNRRRLLIATDIGRGLVMLALPFAPDIWALLLATLAVEVMATLFIPVKDAIVPNLVPRGRLVQANQLSMMSTYATLPVGGFLYAALVSMTGVFDGWAFVQARPASLAIWLNALTFFLSAVFVARIPGISGRPERLSADKHDRPGAWQELVEGLRFVARQPLVRALVTGVMGASLAAGTVMAVGEFYAGVVNAGPNGFGLLQGLVGTGLFLGLVATNWLEPRLGKERLFAPSIGVAGGALVVTALMPRLDLAVAPALLMGAGGGVAFLTGYTLLQEYSSDEIRGRTFGAFNTAVRAALFLSLTAAPFLVGLIGQESRSGGFEIGGVRITLVVAGVLALVGAVWCGWSVQRALSLSGVTVGGAPRTRGLFVVFEGGDGAGKSTQMERLRDVLVEAGLDPIMTREPGGTDLGERIREVVLDPAERDMSDRTEAMLYAAARAQHVAQVITPALADGRVVICDRYVDSSIVYQGVGRGLGREEVARLNRWATGGVQPDLVVLLDVPADEGLARSGSTRDRLEEAGLDFHERVNEAFRRLAAMTPNQYLVLDATWPVEEIHAEIRKTVLRRLDPGAVDLHPDDLPPAVLPPPLPDDARSGPPGDDVEPATGPGPGAVEAMAGLVAPADAGSTGSDDVEAVDDVDTADDVGPTDEADDEVDAGDAAGEESDGPDAVDGRGGATGGRPTNPDDPSEAGPDPEPPMGDHATTGSPPRNRS